MLLYHLDTDPDIGTLFPETPDLLESAEESGTKVVKFAPTINGFLNIIGPINVLDSYEYGKELTKGYYNPEEHQRELTNELGMFWVTNDSGIESREQANIGKTVPDFPQFYVYVPDLEAGVFNYFIPDSKDVFNQPYTGEVDTTVPVKVACVGSIMVISKSMMMKPTKIKWKGGYINYAPYHYEFIRFNPVHRFLSEKFSSLEDYTDYRQHVDGVHPAFIPESDIDDYIDQRVEEISDNIEMMEVSRKSDPMPITKPKQRNQYSLPKKKKEIILKK